VNTRDFTLTTIFLAIILILAFTPLGFIHLGVIKATIIHMPIVIASILLGPKIGAFLGLMFGVTSIISNTIAPTLLSFAFSPVIPVLGTGQGSFWALFVAIVPRVILGFLPYYLYKATDRFLTRKRPTKKMALFLTGLIATLVHTILVMGLIAVLFQDAYAEAVNADSLNAVILAVLTVFFTNGVAEALLAAFITALVVPPLFKFVVRE